MISTHRTETNMRHAFRGSLIRANFSPLGDKVWDSVQKGVGIIHRRDWNASLSKRTYDKLVLEGVMQ